MKLAGFDIGLDRPLFLIAGPCVVESEALQVDVAGRLKEIAAGLGVPFLFKSSYDKANRSSGRSFRGLGIDEGLRVLAEVRRQVGVPVLTDVHGEAELPAVAKVVDAIQTPAFLCRQTDFIRACAQAGRDFLQPAGHVDLQLLAFDHARAGNQEQRPIQPDVEAGKIHAATFFSRPLRSARKASAASTKALNSG